MKQKLLILFLSISISFSAQNWKDYKVNEKGDIIGNMVIGNLNDTIYASGSDGSTYYNSFIYSKDKGATWSEPKGILTADYGSVAQYVGVKDRVFASLKLPSSDYLYYHSKDNGNTWVLDTVGLPHYYGIKSTQKDAFNLKKIGNEYIVAYNGLAVNGAYYKKIGDNSWKPLPTSSSTIAALRNVNAGIVSTTSAWFSLNTTYSITDNQNITKSTDNGLTWQPIAKTGLPSTMIPQTLVSNGKGRLFLGASIASTTNKTAVFYSDDEGKTWQNTNAEVLVPYTGSQFIINIFATGNQAIITYNAGYNQPPLYLYSNTETPNLGIGDSTGLINFPFAFPHVFFNIDDTIYLNHYNDLHSMNTSALNVNRFVKNTSINTYPNPTENQLMISSEKDFEWKLSTIQGKTVMSGDYQTNQQSKTINLETIAKGIYIFSTDNGYRKKIIKK